VILLHDFYPGEQALWNDGVIVRGPWQALERLERERAPLKAVPLGDLRWPTKLGSSRTSLAIVMRRD
jgi:hypothetical protein